MKIRFENQITRINENLEPDNYINPKKLTDIEQAMLKNIFSQITAFQAKLKNDFVGFRG
jgi:CBS domain-containing protein